MEEKLTGNSLVIVEVQKVMEAVKELTVQTTELAKQLREFKELYAKAAKAGRF